MFPSKRLIHNNKKCLHRNDLNKTIKSMKNRFMINEYFFGIRDCANFLVPLY